MGRKADYLKRADYCRRMAEQAEGPVARHAYLVAEDSWRRLASETDVKTSPFDQVNSGA